MGLPSFVLVLADNQSNIAASLADWGAVINLGLAYDVDLKMAGDVVQDLIADQGRRANMSKKGRLLVDGLGSSRVASALDWPVEEGG
jgi:UDP-2,4-diacetamido-2,4,6-trideoxy-beta-L-altropyranose hydrolase